MKLIPPHYLALVVLWLPSAVWSQETAPAASPYQKWTHGPSTNPGFFPIAVWLQDPVNAEKYRQAGINTYVGLWEGPTEDQLAALKKTGMKLICDQNGVGLRHLDDPTIIAWMHGDEPDNAQSLPGDKGYGPPIKPEKIIEEYAQIVKADPSRPVMLNLGQGVAWDAYIGRGVRTNHPEDYRKYLQGADIASFDIYPVVHDNPEVAGKLWYVAQGVDRLVGWANGEKVVWNCLECTHISEPGRKATPHQVRCEAWMSLIHGSQGLIYFVHQFKPKFREAALLDDPEMLAAVTALNKQITSLAPVLNSPRIKYVERVQTDDPKAPVDILVKKYEGSTYLFAVGMRDATAKATFTLPGLTGATVVTVLDENRTLTAKDGVFTDTFASWDVHLYRIDKK
jgi:hypothetical protein